MVGKEATAQEDEADAECITAFSCRRDLEGRGISASSAINTIGAGRSAELGEMVEDEVEDADEDSPAAPSTPSIGAAPAAVSPRTRPAQLTCSPVVRGLRGGGTREVGGRREATWGLAGRESLYYYYSRAQSGYPPL